MGYGTYSGTVAQRDQQAGWPEAPRFPGAITTDHHGDPVDNPARMGPPDGGTPAPGYPSVTLDVTPQAPGVVSDTAAQLGHSALVAPGFPQTEPFAPPGPVANVHGLDTGGTYRNEHVPMPSSPGWFRRVLTGQTWNRRSFTTDTHGWRLNSPNDRTNLDQYTGQDAHGYAPRWIPYSERAVRANFAATAYPVTPASNGGAYVPSAALPSMVQMGGQGNYGYTAPADPVITYAPQAASQQTVIGMEFVSG